MTPTNALSHLNESGDVKFRGVISEEPREGATSSSYTVDVRTAFIDNNWQTREGSVLVRLPPYPRYEYGDLLELEGELLTPPVLEDFDYREYLSRQGIDSVAEYPWVRPIEHSRGNTLKAAIIDLRHELSSSLDSALPDPESSLAGGILFGARSALPRDLRDDMDATGTSHLVAVSGQNVTMLAAVVIAALAWLIGRRAACLIALTSIGLYTLLVGAEASVLRAAIMGTIFVVAMIVGRQNTGWVALLLAAAAMTALDPQVVHDVSFQLSFASVLGLTVLAMPLRDWFQSMIARWPAASDFPLTKPTVDLMSMSAACIAFTIPITAVNFHQVSIAAPLANLFAVPAFVAVAATSAVVILAGLISPAAADYASWLAWPPAAYMVTVVRLFAAFPAASIRITNVSTAHAIVYYALLAAVVLRLRDLSLPVFVEPPRVQVAPRTGLSLAALALVLALSSALVWLVVSSPQSSRLSVTFLDVGQGDAILVESPSGNRILIDGGPSGSALSAALGRSIPFYERDLDLIILTHPQADHAGGLPEALERYNVGAFLTNNLDSDSAAIAHLEASLIQSGVPILRAERGQSIDLGGGAMLTLLNPAPNSEFSEGDLNDRSLVARLTYENVSMLLTGDLGAEGEAALESLGTDLESTVLKVGHHGSRTSTTTEFLDRVDPSLAVISVGASNRFGHPAPEVLGRLEEQTVFRTDQNGDVTVYTDGNQVWVSTQR